MKLVYSAESVAQVAHMRNLLEQVGIRTQLRNYFAGGAVGEIPPVEGWPQLWAVDESEHAHAEQVVAAELAGAYRSGSAWQCPACHERLEPQFTSCWRCGCERPAIP